MYKKYYTIKELKVDTKENKQGMKVMSQTMKSTIPILTKAMKQMDSHGIGKDISKFEKVFEDMEVKTGEMDAALENVYGASIA